MPDGVVSCPRKGRFGNTIAWARCIEMQADCPKACVEHTCQKHEEALVEIQVRARLGGGNTDIGGAPRKSPRSGPRSRRAPVVSEPVDESDAVS